MALYLNGNKLKINLDGTTYNLKSFNVISNLDEVVLLSSDGCILKDCNGLYLLPKESE